MSRHQRIVAEDAMQPDWPWEVLSDEGTHVIGAIERPEGYERTSATDVAMGAAEPTWATLAKADT